MKTPVSVVLIRENAEQLTGGGCCGSLDDDDPTLGGRELFVETKKHRAQLGLLHRAIRRLFPPDAEGRDRVAVVVVDPRNQLYLAPKLLGDVLRYRPGLFPGLRTMLQAFSLPAVVVNGRVISGRNREVDPDTLCHAIREVLREPCPAGFPDD